MHKFYPVWGCPGSKNKCFLGVRSRQSQTIRCLNQLDGNNRASLRLPFAAKDYLLLVLWLYAEILEIQGGPVRFGSVRLRFGGRTVQAVPVFGSGGSSAREGFLCFSTV